MVCFVVLHYLAIDETKLCIESIKNNVIGEKKIIVVDNASPNNSIRELHKLYDSDVDIDVIGSEINVGFAKGNNIGYKFSVEKYNPDFIVVMNNDMEIKQNDFIKKIEESYDKYHYYILGPDIYSTKKNYHQNPQIRKIETKSELKKSYKKLWIKNKLSFLIPIKWKIKTFLKNKESEKNLQYNDRQFIKEVLFNPLLHGSCYIFSKLFITAHPSKCFFDGTFMYLEAEILYYQAKRDNELMIYYPYIHIDHHEDISTDAEFKKQYEKSIFSIKCLKQSVKSFIRLMEEDENESGYRC